MSIAGILSSSLFSSNTQSVHSRMQQFRQDFQKAGSPIRRHGFGATGLPHTAAKVVAVRVVAWRAQRSGEQRRQRNGVILVLANNGAGGSRSARARLSAVLWRQSHSITQVSSSA